VRRKLIEQLHSEAFRGGGDFALNALRERIGPDAAEFGRILHSLQSEEILEVEGDRARLNAGTLLLDHLRLRGPAGASASPSVVTGGLISDSLKRAPRLMSREYRRAAAVGLREILSTFDLQEMPRGLFDYRIFRDRVRGEDEDAALAALFADDDRVNLPQIAHVAPLADYLPAFADVTEPERSVAARGFATRSYTDEDEIVWLAAEIDSKLEADEALTREWTERLENAAREIGFANFRIWLVAPEGFSQAALDHLAYRGAFGSSRRQAELIKQRLSGRPALPDEGLKEFELVIPVGDETELIAAHALEEISRRYDYPPKAVNQMKTALVEACINAAEHGLSPDRKIYQKFAVGERKVVITVSNRGLRLSDRMARGEAAQSELGEGRRGWGLNLIRGLMDEVRVEPVDDGTRIVMTKLIPAA
jgi:serine/threonine-protein kinase RsbW